MTSDIIFSLYACLRMPTSLMFEQFYGLSVLLFVLPSGGSEITEIIINLLIQIAVILFAAKIAGELASRYLKLPPVLAELGVDQGPARAVSSSSICLAALSLNVYKRHLSSTSTSQKALEHSEVAW